MTYNAIGMISSQGDHLIEKTKTDATITITIQKRKIMKRWGDENELTHPQNKTKTNCLSRHKMSRDLAA